MGIAMYSKSCPIRGQIKRFKKKKKHSKDNACPLIVNDHILYVRIIDNCIEHI